MALGLWALLWNPISVAFFFGLTTCCLTVALRHSVATRDAHASIHPTHATPRGCTTIGAEIAADTLALIVTAAESREIALLILLLAVGSSPWFWQRVRCLAKQTEVEEQAALVFGPTSAAQPAAAPDENAESIRRLSNAELCQEWRRSYPLLMNALTQDERWHLVALRGRYLEEMDRRDPQALRTWLASGARAAGAPDRYLGQDPPRGLNA